MRPRMLRGLVANALVAVLAALTLLPLGWMVTVSFMPRGEASRSPPPFWPSRWSWENYHELLVRRLIDGAWFDYRVLPALWNSLAIAALATLLALLLTVPAGYAFAKLRFAGRARLLRLLVISLIVPGQVAMLPLFLILKEVGLVNSYAGVILPSLAGVFAILFVRQAALGIPDEMIDAARLDGASEARIFASIVLPLLSPIVVTLAMFLFLASWNDFLWPLIVLSDQHKYTLPVAIAAIGREHAAEGELMMAAAVVTTLPVLAIFLALQRHYMTGLLGGSVKG
ncbi:carbohydrate ABC transporter permease [Sphingomonas carotinifaciens]|uniref:ABC transporter permease subunit n=1 Tax=Sphingomonas carotinifaciens TaxID=1166323 RepID=A0A1G7MK97_9SPHN|nr:carbohydrate ABC transporter permease [Sphingomonas carotinifaciens]MBB4086774.1 multiple sugar transport system permease protein [Sphingomonas carotinifaciens]MWC42243.1 ABC transporter permease subunit [Sphingomonas carotinifaciens]SDF62318.1 carbohydrate ABC transporter membrane protein 2, CUT1 family [Sphingomonas carotinifaciens]